MEPVFAKQTSCDASRGRSSSEINAGIPLLQWHAVAHLAIDYHWIIRSMEIDDGCCELLVTGPGGNTLEVKPDPGTFDVVDARVEKFADEGAMSPAAPSKEPSN